MSVVLLVTRFALVCLILMAPAWCLADDLVILQDTFLNDDVSGNLFVGGGAICVASNIHVAGSVTVEEDASFYGIGVQIDSDLNSRFAANVTLRSSATQFSSISGDVHLARSSGALRLINAQIDGHLLFDENPAFDIIVKNCLIGGDVQLFANAATRKIAVRKNSIVGNIQQSQNLPAPILVNNTVAGPEADGSLVEIRFSGDEGSERCELRIDGLAVRDWLAATELRTFRYKASDLLSEDQVRVALTNNASGPNGFNRNLTVDYLVIDGTTFQTEAATVYSTGTWVKGLGKKPGFHQSERLNGNGFFQYGIAGEEDELVRLAMNSVLADGWRHILYNDGIDIRWRSLDPSGQETYSGRIGSAGVISGFQESQTGKPFLAPSFQGENTDRVLQWSVWETGTQVVHVVPQLPAYEHRFNMTQAGNFQDDLQRTVDVGLFSDHGRLDVWSVADRLWKSELDSVMEGQIASLTRTMILDSGAIMVRRVIRIGEIRLNGQATTIEKPYIDSWNPFSDNTFKAIALNLNPYGIPDQYYIDSINIPGFPHWPADSTNGWAIAYTHWNIANAPALAVVFGRDHGRVVLPDGTTADPPRLVLNTMDFAGGFAMLAGIWLNELPANSIIDQTVVFAPSRGIQSGTKNTLDGLSGRLPPPRVYYPGAPHSDELSAIIHRLENLGNQSFIRTDHLGVVK